MPQCKAVQNQKRRPTVSSYLKGGWKKKYIIEKASGKPLDPKAKYFVLRYDAKGDPFARAAMRAYAVNVRRVNPRLADDILARVDREEKRACGQCYGLKRIYGRGPNPHATCPTCGGSGLRKPAKKAVRGGR